LGVLSCCADRGSKLIAGLRLVLEQRLRCDLDVVPKESDGLLSMVHDIFQKPLLFLRRPLPVVVDRFEQLLKSLAAIQSDFGAKRRCANGPASAMSIIRSALSSRCESKIAALEGHREV
jgi:hypothetical protein